MWVYVLVEGKIKSEIARQEGTYIILKSGRVKVSHLDKDGVHFSQWWRADFYRNKKGE